MRAGIEARRKTLKRIQPGRIIISCWLSKPTAQHVSTFAVCYASSMKLDCTNQPAPDDPGTPEKK